MFQKIVCAYFIYNIIKTVMFKICLGMNDGGWGWGEEILIGILGDGKGGVLWGIPLRPLFQVFLSGILSDNLIQAFLLMISFGYSF